MEKEDGEMSDDNMLVEDDENKILADSDKRTVVLYKADKNGLIVEQLEKIDAVKLEERAKRFGLNLTGSRVVTQKQIDELYANSGITGNERHFRFDTIFLYGVDGLSTKEIFEYLEDYKPVSIEWIEDNSCNVVCQDHISAALALLVHSREIRNEELINMLADKSSHHWREGMPHPQVDLILMRFATNGDKKMSKKMHELKTDRQSQDVDMEAGRKNPWGDLCKSWGVYDHQEVFNRKLRQSKDEEDEQSDEPEEAIRVRSNRMAMRLGKRTHNVEDNDSSDSDSEWKKRSKAPRMRMHADDEESKQKKKRPEPPSEDDEESFAPLSIEVANTHNSYTPRKNTKLSDKFRSKVSNSVKDGVHSRLGVKVDNKIRTEISDEYSSDDSDHNTMSRVERVNPTSNVSSVWSRLETKSKQSHDQNDLRDMLKSRGKNHKQKSDDLRDRLGRSRQLKLRIEVNNQ